MMQPTTVLQQVWCLQVRLGILVKHRTPYYLNSKFKASLSVLLTWYLDRCFSEFENINLCQKAEVQVLTKAQYRNHRVRRYG